jgi:hypothetical protein
MILSHILKSDRSASADSAAEVAGVWEEVVNAIIQEMLEYSLSQMEDVHFDLREEMTLELAKFMAFISEKVVNDRLGGRSISEIDVQTERKQCFDEAGKVKISTTAKQCAEHIWLKKYSHRWKPKTEAALKKEKLKNKIKISPKKVEDNHFIPCSFIKRYWSEGQFVYRNIKVSGRQIERQHTPVGSWGFQKNLYSEHLEAYFGLLEGDAVRPIQMILNVEPLNRPQREALVGFIVIQRLRNPYFMELLKSTVAPIVAAEVGEGKDQDADYMRAVYESLYSQNNFYDKLARPIMYSRWVILQSDDPDYVLPDVCNLFGNYEGSLYVVMPLTPTDCLIVLPVAVQEPRIVPHYIKATKPMAREISYVLRCVAKKEFLSVKTTECLKDADEEPNKVMQRIILSLAKITADN